MPPRKQPKNIISNGSAGNSSKSKSKAASTSTSSTNTGTNTSSLNATTTTTAANRINDDGTLKPPPLFPQGYKSPVVVLNEKCQKRGWERPVLDVFPVVAAGTSVTTSNTSTTTCGDANDPTNAPPTKRWTGTPTLRRRRNKNAMDLEVVRLGGMPEPLEGWPGDGKVEGEGQGKALGRCYVAVWALFRFCNNLPLAMTLPPSLRPYWSQLLLEKKNAPEHRDWEWMEDPFEAKKIVDSRQSKKREQVERQAEFKRSIGGDFSVAPAQAGREVDHMRTGGGGGLARGWTGVPEVKMTVAQREVVEGVVRKMMSKYPSAIMEATRESDATGSNGAGPSGTSNVPSLDPMPINRQLKHMGFRPAHVDSCCRALVAAHDRLHRPPAASSSSRPTQDPLMLSLSLLAPLEAAIEWLLVHLPEDDLPAAYRSSASVDFVSSVKGGQGGQAELRKTWVADKLARKAGFPRKVVETVVADAVQDDGIVKESMVIDLLGRRLCGWEDDEQGWGTEEYGNGWEGDETEREERRTSREEELIILESVLDDRIQKVGDDELAIEITDVPGQDLVLNVVFSDHSPYPSSRYPTHPPAFYLTSRSLPAYLRLHLHAEVLRAFRDPERPDLRGMLEAGAGGAVYAMMETLEAALPACLENPPDIASVTQYLVPKIEDAPQEVQVRKRMQKLKMRGGRGRQSGMTEAEIKTHHEAMQNAPGWQTMLEARQRLPAWSSRQHIIDALESNRVVVIVGETGSGKSTQSPSYILDHEISQGRGASTNIIVTQPRRVAAIGVATRVAEERMEDLDKAAQTVGYVIRGESRTNARMSKITFCTTGVVLRRLASGGDADLEGVSHVIVDEVHERSVDGDFLLLQLREVLKRNKKIKVILMSATINQEQFINYFGGAPAIEIPGFTHPVEDFYMEDYLPKLQYRAETPRFKIKQTEDQKTALKTWLDGLNLDPNSRQSLESLSIANQIPYDLIGALVAHIEATSMKPDDGVLIFLPGVAEIKQCIDAIRQKVRNVDIFPLHANLSNAEQKQVFAKTKRRKVVVATNVAETSVTIADIVYVIDSGKVKETQFDPDTSMSRLVETYTSRAASRQRRGRAGRTKPGICYKIFSRRTENQHMARFAIPEILRTPLESLFLQVKSMDPDADVKQYLSKAIDPPKVEAMDAAWKTLIDLGAVEGEALTSRLTALGRHMSALPVDLRLAKMLVLACIFRALDPVLTIAAMLSSKPLFSGPMEKREEMKKARERFAWGQSDILLNLRAYTAAVACGGYSAMRSFCEDNFVNFNTIRDITSLRQDFQAALAEIGLIDFPGRGARRDDVMEEWNVNSENENLLKAILVGAFWPRIVRIRLPDAKFEKVQAGSVAKEHEAREVKYYDSVDNSRVFIHPGSILFHENNLKLGYITFFHRAETSKVFLFDATPVPLFALLLFGGQLTINHFAGGITIGKEGNIRLKAWSRIGILANQLRRLLDARLAEVIESSGEDQIGKNDDIVTAMLTLLPP